MSEADKVLEVSSEVSNLSEKKKDEEILKVGRKQKEGRDNTEVNSEIEVNYELEKKKEVEVLTVRERERKKT